MLKEKENISWRIMYFQSDNAVKKAVVEFNCKINNDPIKACIRDKRGLLQSAFSFILHIFNLDQDQCMMINGLNKERFQLPK